MGEDGLIDLLSRVFLLLPGSGVQLGIGDDAAVLEARPPGSRSVVTADAFVEGTHFVLPHQVAPAIVDLGDRLARELLLGMERSNRLLAHSIGAEVPEEIPGRPRPKPATWEDAWMMALGHRLAMANLSDLAAMGAIPDCLTLTIAAPGDMSARGLGFLAQGLHEAGTAARAPLVGGDTVKTSGPLVVSVQALGHLGGTAPTYLRSCAQPGDLLWLTGPVGCGQLAPELFLGCYPGFEALMKTGPGRRDVINVLVRNMTTSARLGVVNGLSVPSRGGVAVTDVSDGLTREAHRMARASLLHLHVDVDRVPVYPAAARLMEHLSEEERLARVMGSGEEWQLLVALAPTPKPPRPQAGVRWANIGHGTRPEHPGTGAVSLWRGEKAFSLPDRTYQHFPGGAK